MEKAEKWMLGGALILAIIVMEAIVFGGLGLGVVVGVGAYFICFTLFSKLYHRTLSKMAKWLLVPIVLCTLCFVVFGETVLRGFNLIFLAVLVLIHALEVFKKCEQEAFLPAWLGEVFNLGVTLPFANINKPVVLMKNELGTGQKRNIKVIGKILLGLVIAVPMLLVVIFLLASADAAFEGVIDFVFENISFNANQLGAKVFFVITLFFMFFSYFYGLSHKQEKQKREVYYSEKDINHYVLMEEESDPVEGEDKGEVEDKDRDKDKDKEEVREPHLEASGSYPQQGIYLDFVVISTIATMLCFIYLIFCLSQLAYFVSAFSGILPADFTSAEYARRGFFETVPLAGFNLLAIMILSYVSQREQGKKSIYIKGMISFITAFTAFIVVCALSKMFMYMGRYGLSLWRVYVAWFLVLSLAVVALVFAKVFWKKLQLIKMVFIVFIVMYLGLNYGNVDYLVASQNVKLYEEKKMNDLSGCYNISTSAMGPIAELVKSHPEILKQESEEVYYNAVGIINRLEYQLLNKNWQSWNLADSKANEAFEEIKKLGYESHPIEEVPIVGRARLYD